MALEGNDMKAIIKNIKKINSDIYVSCCPGNIKNVIKSQRISLLNPLVRFAGTLKLKALIEWYPTKKRLLKITFKKIVEEVVAGYKKFIRSHQNGKYEVLVSFLGDYCSKQRLTIIETILSRNSIVYRCIGIAHAYPAYGGLDTVGFFVINKKTASVKTDVINLCAALTTKQ